MEIDGKIVWKVIPNVPMSNIALEFFSESLGGTQNDDQIFGWGGNDIMNGYGGDDILHS